MGSVSVVQHAQQGVTTAAQVRSPLLHDGVLLYPNLARTVSLRDAADLTFAFSVLPMGEPVDGAEVVLSRGPQVVGQAEVALNPPGSDGRIQQIASLPAIDLTPGTYDLRVAVRSGAGRVSRAARVTVTP